jgi:HAD superfamily hydrolase (TIGR01509 family)
MATPGLVIFDCDGVLVDSEPIANRIFAEMLTAAGLPIGYEETVRTFMGRSMPVCVEIASDRLGRPLPDGFVEELRRRTAEAFRRELRSVPGVEAALDAIRAPVCVASSGEHAKIRTTLGITGLLGRFEGRIFSAADVARPKPFPDLFLHAAASLGVPPERCAVVEDTALGAAAGVAAGMRVLGYAGVSDPGALAAAGAEVFRDMAELPRLLLEPCSADV